MPDILYEHLIVRLVFPKNFPAILVIVLHSKISFVDILVSILGRQAASLDLPFPGGPNIKRLCHLMLQFLKLV
ncbi:hypothetical protein BTU51_0520 [Rickettsia rickettsii]|uniref:Uncharacterized protein n=1 Tax=Rickettsia rickettsii (strain Iowa) TaxID=452659 RepID=B0BX24_RICRO|nr:hypothetical protein RrIowa_0520 [Rickettsia rickettsii str. Iowa]APU55352.1 hypothetical protein BTU50_0520 [Rickettsia rickettsii]APU56729.1 hypothetical protein BTU51_0520 [Rickettsia rickettsii]